MAYPHQPNALKAGKHGKSGLEGVSDRFLLCAKKLGRKWLHVGKVLNKRPSRTQRAPGSRQMYSMGARDYKVIKSY